MFWRIEIVSLFLHHSQDVFSPSLRKSLHHSITSRIFFVSFFLSGASLPFHCPDATRRRWVRNRLSVVSQPELCGPLNHRPFPLPNEIPSSGNVDYYFVTNSRWRPRPINSLLNEKIGSIGWFAILHVWTQEISFYFVNINYRSALDDGLDWKLIYQLM